MSRGNDYERNLKLGVNTTSQGINIILQQLQIIYGFDIGRYRFKDNIEMYAKDNRRKDVNYIFLDKEKALRQFL
jgi:hypothetical protein